MKHLYIGLLGVLLLVLVVLKVVLAIPYMCCLGLKDWTDYTLERIEDLL